MAHMLRVLAILLALALVVAPLAPAWADNPGGNPSGSDPVDGHPWDDDPNESIPPDPGGNRPQPTDNGGVRILMPRSAAAPGGAGWIADALFFVVQSVSHTKVKARVKMSVHRRTR